MTIIYLLVQSFRHTKTKSQLAVNIWLLAGFPFVCIIKLFENNVNMICGYRFGYEIV